MTATPIPRLLSIAGSDSGGGAGIQADLKAFARCGAHGMTAITAITAQNTLGVSAIQAIEPEIVVAQVRAVVEDIGVDAVKVGMLGTVATIEAVAAGLDLLPAGTPVVVDPVMVAESGAALLEEPARAALIALILPRATVATPNLPEARALTGAAGPPTAEIEAGAGEAAALAASGALARAVHALGVANVVVTGGHRDPIVDVLFDGDQVTPIRGRREAGDAAHGSGCTHSSVLAAELARGASVLDAATKARALAAAAVRDGLHEIGRGPGPVNVLGIGRDARHDAQRG